MSFFFFAVKSCVDYEIFIIVYSELELKYLKRMFWKERDDEKVSSKRDKELCPYDISCLQYFISG